MFSEGSIFGADQGTSTGQGAMLGERRNTGPWLWRLLCQIQPGAVG